MAHWAEIDSNSIVLRATVGNDNDPDEGYQWLIDNLGGTWIKTSYNTYGGVHALGGTPFRKNFGITGSTYDSVRDAFIPPKPYPSWLLDSETYLWGAPTPMPTDGAMYSWNENEQSWDLVE
jgi:hypothetical protein